MNLKEPGKWQITYSTGPFNGLPIWRASCKEPKCDWHARSIARFPIEMLTEKHHRDAHPTQNSELSTQHPELP